MSDEPARAALRSDNNEDRLSLHPGTLIADAYVVDRVLGVGGMGTVVAARTIDTGEVVAIKFMLPHFAAHQQLLIRFQREARATERVQSRHVRRVIFAGQMSARIPYIVMEYLDGEDLRSLVKREGPLEPRQAATYIAQACTGLAEAHALGIVHRDMKPANLFLARRPDGPSIIKVLDFGVAKFDSPNVSGDTIEVTEVETMVGSRLYMAPEQITNPQEVNVLADVWALGAILYFLLTGSTPFAAATPAEVLVNVLREPPHRLQALRRDVPVGLVAVVERCLAKDRGDRYANVTELARALLPFMRAQDEEPVPSARHPKELTRTLKLVDFRVPSKPPPGLELAPEPIAASPEEATTLEATTKETPARAQETPVLPFAQPPRRPRGIVLGWVASAVAGGLIAIAVGRPPAAQATSVIAPAPPLPERVAVAAAAPVVSAAPPVPPPENVGLALNTEDLPDVVPAPVKQAPARQAPAPRSPAPPAPAPSVATNVTAGVDFPATPLFQMPNPDERRDGAAPKTISSARPAAGRPR